MKLDVEFDESFDRPIAVVWKAVTDARILARWLMDNDFEPRVGHRFTLRDPPTATWRGWVDCEVLELDPPHRMVWSWNGDGEGEKETRLTFELRSDGDVTRLSLRHEGQAPVAEVDSLGAGWTRKLGVLKRVVGPNYATRVAFRSPPEKVFAAIATIDGIKSWWTPLVSGSANPGGELCLRFEGLDEHIRMRVEEAKAPSLVRWKCIEHTGLDDEWNESTILFNVSRRGPQGSELSFEHLGLTAKLDCFDMCELGWDHFLRSLASVVDLGVGAPFGTKKSGRER